MCGIPCPFQRTVLQWVYRAYRNFVSCICTPKSIEWDLYQKEKLHYTKTFFYLRLLVKTRASPSHSIPNKSRQLPFISPQNKQDALTKLQLSGKGYTNGPSPYGRMQLILKRPTSSTQISSPTSGSEAPHKNR